MDFKELEYSHRAALAPILRAKNSCLSEYSFTNAYLFRKPHNYQVAESDGCTFLHGVTYDNKTYMMPVCPLEIIPQKKLIEMGALVDFFFPIQEEWLSFFPEDKFVEAVVEVVKKNIDEYKDYGNQEYTVFELDNEGNKVAEYPLEKANCWFPSLPVFTEEGTLNGMETPDIQNEISSPFKLTGNQLTVKGMAGKKLLIFRTDGTLVTTYAVNNNLDILTLSILSGLYIIQSGNASVKIRIDQ